MLPLLRTGGLKRTSSSANRAKPSKYYPYSTFLISGLAKSSGTDYKSFAEKSGNYISDHRPVAKSTGYFEEVEEV